MRIRQSGGKKFNCLYGNGDVFVLLKDDLLLKGIDIYWIDLATSTRENVYIKKVVPTTKSTTSTNSSTAKPTTSTNLTTAKPTTSTNSSTTTTTSTEIEILEFSKLRRNVYNCKDTNGNWSEFKRSEMNVDESFIR